MCAPEDVQTRLEDICFPLISLTISSPKSRSLYPEDDYIMDCSFEEGYLYQLLALLFFSPLSSGRLYGVKMQMIREGTWTEPLLLVASLFAGLGSLQELRIGLQYGASIPPLVFANSSTLTYLRIDSKEKGNTKQVFSIDYCACSCVILKDH